MTWANMVAEVNATNPGERTEDETVWPWHELDYALLVADSVSYTHLTLPTTSRV